MGIAKMSKKVDNIAFIVGAGAVQNAWDPVTRAISKIHGAEVDGDGANFIFARLVYLLRFYSTGTFAESNDMLTPTLAFSQALKDEISKELIKAEKENEIHVRPEFESILFKFILSEVNKSILISTNWDTVVNNSINKIAQSNKPYEGSDIETVHIHGSILSPLELYLPSEIANEVYRSKESQVKIGTMHGDIWRALEHSHKSVIYGLSLDPLDAELSQTLAAGWDNNNTNEIIIINPSHEKVANRVKLLLNPSRDIKVSGYSPTNLSKKIEY